MTWFRWTYSTSLSSARCRWCRSWCPSWCRPRWSTFLRVGRRRGRIGRRRRRDQDGRERATERRRQEARPLRRGCPTRSLRALTRGRAWVAARPRARRSRDDHARYVGGGVALRATGRVDDDDRGDPHRDDAGGRGSTGHAAMRGQEVPRFEQEPGHSHGAAATRRQVAGGGCTQQQRCQDAGQVGVDLGQLEIDRRAASALVKVLVDLGGVATGQAIPDPRAQSFGHPSALLGRGVGHVHLQVGLAQTFTGAVGERGHAVGRHAEQHSDLGGLLTLDLDVPQHELPALGQGGESFGCRQVLELLHGRVHEGDARVERLELVGRSNPGVVPDAVDVQSTDGSEQVRPEGEVGTATGGQDLEDLDEGVGDEIVGVAGSGQLTGQAQGRGPVPFEQHPVGVPVTTSNGRDELAVARGVQVRRHGTTVHAAIVTLRHPFLTLWCVESISPALPRHRNHKPPSSPRLDSSSRKGTAEWCCSTYCSEKAHRARQRRASLPVSSRSRTPSATTGRSSPLPRRSAGWPPETAPPLTMS